MRIKFGLKEGVFKKLAVGIMLSVLLSAAACGSGIEFAPDSFKPSGTKAETKAEECYSFAEESTEPVVYDAEKLAELKKMLMNYSVEYGYEELFDYEKATEGISVDHTVESHQYSALDVAGKLTKEHLCEIVQENNDRIHQEQDHRIGEGSDHQPRPELTESGSCLCNDDAHQWVVEGIEHTGRHEDDAHGDGAHAHDVLEVIQNVRGGKHVDHVLAHRGHSV